MMRVFGEIIKSLLMDALWALGLSGFFSIIRIIFHGSVTRGQFFGGARMIFLVLVLDYIYNWVRTLVLMKKDPVFKSMTMRTGISWRDYKRMNKHS